MRRLHAMVLAGIQCRRMLVYVFPSFGAVERSYSNSRDIFRRHHSRVNRYATALQFLRVFIACHAPTMIAVIKLDKLIIPGVWRFDILPGDDTSRTAS